MADAADLIDAIRRWSHPANPRPPELPARFSRLLGAPLPRSARAVLLDIYGTLFTSASGDIGLTDSSRAEAAVVRALSETGHALSRTERSEQLAREFRTQIERAHARARGEGAEYPEIDVREMWRRAFDAVSVPYPEHGFERFALLYELAANPVWPMPGARSLLDRLRGRLRLGLVSNAQFFTPLLFPALLGGTPGDHGFSPELIAYSFETGVAKPAVGLFSAPLAELARQGIDSSQVVYVGNDMLNDVATAEGAGCMTILFAGDARSLRLRDGDPRVGRLLPDSVVRSFDEIGALVPAPKEI